MMLQKKRDLTDHIRIAMVNKGVGVGYVGKKIQEDPKNISVNLSRRRLTQTTAERYANALNCDLVLRDRDTGEIY